MTATKNRLPGVAPRASGSMDYDGSSSAKVIRLPTAHNTRSPFDELTASLVLAQYRAGTLPEGVIVAMMASAGLRP